MKTLLLHASAGAGHRRAAEALAQAFKLENQGGKVAVFDILDFTPALFRRTYAKGYLDLVRKAPELWGYFYSRTDQKASRPARREIRRIFNELNTLRFHKHLRAFDPDAIVCTHFMPLDLISSITRLGLTDIPLFCAITDFAIHALWLADHVRRYYVATAEAQRSLVRKGIDRERILVTGIPIDPVFSQSEPRESACRRFGLDPALPSVLLLSGGFGVGPTADLVESLVKSDFACSLLVVAGANEDMRKRVQAIAETGRRDRVKVFGFVSNIHQLMDASDVVISKPGGLTSSEVLAKGKPMVIVDPIPGQEQRNCEYLLESGVAIRLYEPEDAPYKLAELLGNRKVLAGMQSRSRRLGRPAAAQSIVRDVLASVKAIR